MSNAWWADPIFLGHYPKEAAALFGDKLYTLSDEEWALVSQPLDFYGYNCYQGTLDYPVDPMGYDNYGYQGCPKTDMGWNVTDDALYWSSKFLYERYGKPVLITENGFAGLDWVSLDGKVHDPACHPEGDIRSEIDIFAFEDSGESPVHGGGVGDLGDHDREGEPA